MALRRLLLTAALCGAAAGGGEGLDASPCPQLDATGLRRAVRSVSRNDTGSGALFVRFYLNG